MVIEGKGKKILNEGLSGQIAAERIGNAKNCIIDNIESSEIKNIILKVNSFSGRNQSRPVQEEVDFNPKNDGISGKGNSSDKELLNETLNCNEQGDVGEVIGAWSKPKHIRIDFKNEQVELSEDGIAMKLNPVIEAKNSEVLKNLIVIKVLGGNVPYSVCSFDLRKKWNKFGGFHMTSIGMNWILCSFKTSEAVDEVLNGGPWYVNGYIVGMDRWSSAFDPYSFKGISAPVWIRLPCLPLFCWDEDSLARIASRFGTPLYLDGNTFWWGKREFASICVKIDLEKKLPNGVWIDGLAGRFFQWVEYEKINLLCYQCGRAGHELKTCPEKVVLGIKNQAMGNSEEVISEFKNRRVFKGVDGHRNNNSSKNRVKDNLGKIDQNIVLQEQDANGKENKEQMEENSVQGTNVNKGVEVEKCKARNCLNNSFTILNEDNDIDCHEEHEDSVKLLIKRKEGMNADAMTEVKPNLNGSAKVKLAKELKSLGGARKREAALYLKEVVKDHDVFFIGLMETKMSIINRKDVDVLIGKEWDFYHFSTVGLSGGILVLWNTKIGNFVITDTSSQERETLWSLLNKCMVSSNPSIIGGDFNCVLNKDEKRGGKRFLFTKGPRDMKGFMTSCDFHDVGIIGPRYTWCNNKEGKSRIWERLDRCLLNSTALKLLPSAATRHLARVASDHSPITFKANEKERIKFKIIRFEDTWRMYPAARSIVYHSWMKNDFGEEGMVLQRKINRTLKVLFFWSKSKCKDLNELKVKLKMEIMELQSKEAMGNDWSAQDLILLRSKIHELNVILKRLFTWWNQRAKARWLEEGDYNSNLFHNFATARRNGWPEIVAHQKMNDEDIQVLSSDFSVMELKKSVFQQGNSCSPGIDGLTSSFYKYYWDIVWKDLWNAVNIFFTIGCMRKEWKDTLIVLIAKVKNPLLPSNYRPISLCQTNYKVVATMLVNRLKMCMPKLITEEQMAFIHGRSISEHCLLAQEILHKFKVSRNRKGMMALKLDMEQAYDSMVWPTLDHILKWYGFPPGYANLIMECIIDVRCINQWPTFADCAALEGLCIKQLMLENGQWNIDLLQVSFHPELVKMISSIQVDSSREDFLEMQKFYPSRIVTGLAFEQVLRRRFSLIDEDYYNWLNKLKLSKKVEMFWWRLGNSSIPTS
ncbi:hypothetical protein KFK09_026442 [Dendrobium nobile]|uniref:CCHC-type domain-containing protein n=1 Tax=Dendrobium nobile TaxID=94219 RepID=A0A8T3A6K0_DENNO|nr:hypothetical protein KFK09_026442 [Dendrobium nobile]